MVERVALADGYLDTAEVNFEEFLVAKLRLYLADRLNLLKSL